MSLQGATEGSDEAISPLKPIKRLLRRSLSLPPRNDKKSMNDDQFNSTTEQTSELNKQLTNRKREGRLGLIIIMVIAVLLAYWIRQGLSKGIILREPQGEYQAVFLTNDQIYFGHIINQNQEEIILSDIYYFTTLRALQYNGESKTSTDTLNTTSDTFSLLKLGSELHEPKDEMRINRNHVLFIEDLKEDSKVIKAIKEYRETKKETKKP